MENLLFSQTLKEIKKKTTLRSVIEAYGIKVANPNKFISCPFHSGDNTPSCKLYNADTAEGTYYCFACKKKGDLLNFVCDYENKNNSEALSILCRRIGIDPLTKETTNYLLDSIKSMLAPKKPKPLKELEYLKIAHRAEVEFTNIKTSNLTNYLIKKQVPHFGTKSSGVSLVVPVCDENDRIWNLQYISPSGAKYYMEGGTGRRRGCMFRIGAENPNFAFLSEGYSTAATVYLCAEKTVYCCFNAGNIPEVFKVLRDKYPGIKLIVAGDNDLIGHGHGLVGVYPPEKDMDFNDMYLKYGLEEVKQQLLGGLDEKAL